MSRITVGVDVMAVQVLDADFERAEHSCKFNESVEPRIAIYRGRPSGRALLTIHFAVTPMAMPIRFCPFCGVSVE